MQVCRLILAAALAAAGWTSTAMAAPMLDASSLRLDAVQTGYTKGPKGWKGGGRFKPGKAYSAYGRGVPPGWSRGRKVGWYKNRGYRSYAPYRSRRVYFRF